MPRNFFVSMIRDHRVAILAGPFTTHTEALSLVDDARRIALEVDPFCHFDTFGTCSSDTDRWRGSLNARLGIAMPGPSNSSI